MNKQSMIAAFLMLLAVFIVPAQAGIYDFGGGVRIPAGSCTSYKNTPKAELLSSSGGVAVYNMDGKIDVSIVCQLPVPEKALVRQFVLTGNVTKGTIYAELGAVRWNAPRQYVRYGSLEMSPSTGYEVPDMKQKKVVQNLPTSGNGVLKIDRVNSYFIEARFYAKEAVNIEEALEAFYFEVYWD